jgi:hypothetical protein
MKILEKSLETECSDGKQVPWTECTRKDLAKDSELKSRGIADSK